MMNPSRPQGQGTMPGKPCSIPWPALPDTACLEFARIGNRRRFEALWFARHHTPAVLARAECVEHKGRFRDAITIVANRSKSIWGNRLLRILLAARQPRAGGHYQIEVS